MAGEIKAPVVIDPAAEDAVVAAKRIEQERRAKLAAEIADWIQALESDGFAEREAASAALLAIGEPALEKLQAVLADPPGQETRFRASKIVAAIREQLLVKDAVRLERFFTLVRDAERGQKVEKELEERLEKLLAVINAATNRSFTLPVRFAGLIPDPTGQTEEKALIVARQSDLRSISNSIVLADVGVEISDAKNCIIIARVSADVSYCENCIVLAGHDLGSSLCRNSILLSGGTASHWLARGCVIGAPESSDFSSRDKSVVINSPPPRRSYRDETERVETKGLLLSGEALASWSDKITLTFLYGAREGFVLFRNESDGAAGGEYVARVDQPLCDSAGKELVGFEGWKLVHVGSRIAVFGKKGDYAVARRDRQR